MSRQRLFLLYGFEVQFLPSSPTEGARRARHKPPLDSCRLFPLSSCNPLVRSTVSLQTGRASQVESRRLPSIPSVARAVGKSRPDDVVVPDTMSCADISE